MPGSSRRNQLPLPSSKTTPSGSQTQSDRLTLLSGKTLCGSQYSKGPKKFQLGPRRKVPSTIRVHPQDDEAEQEGADGELRAARR